MAKNPEFDLSEAHRYFSAFCFNKVWEFIDKTNRTTEEDDEMIRLSHASLWHWTQREDCTNKSLSTGYWQLSRVYAITGRVEGARRYAKRSLQHSDEDPFLTAYAYEALARAEKLAGHTEQAAKHRAVALRLADAIADPADRKYLTDDLETL